MYTQIMSDRRFIYFIIIFYIIISILNYDSFLLN